MTNRSSETDETHPTPTINAIKVGKDRKQKTQIFTQRNVLSFDVVATFNCAQSGPFGIRFYIPPLRSFSFTLHSIRVSLVLIHLFIFIFVCVMCMPGGNLFLSSFPSFRLHFSPFALFVCDFALILSFLCLFRKLGCTAERVCIFWNEPKNALGDDKDMFYQSNEQRETEREKQKKNRIEELFRESKIYLRFILNRNRRRRQKANLCVLFLLSLSCSGFVQWIKNQKKKKY